MLVRLWGKLEKTVGTDHDEKIHSLIQALQPKAASAGVGLVRGAQVGKYTLVRELGKGGNGEVWQATRVRGDRTVTEALKFLYRADDTATQRFLGEIGTLAELDHEHIARVYDRGLPVFNVLPKNKIVRQHEVQCLVTHFNKLGWISSTPYTEANNAF